MGAQVDRLAMVGNEPADDYLLVDMPDRIPTIPPAPAADRESPLAAWDVSPDAFPAAASPEAQWRYLLRYAILAPSSHNSQPWRWTIAGSVLRLHADTSRHLPVVDPLDRELLISCGAALFNLRVALAHFGFADGYRLLPDGEAAPCLAEMTLEPRPSRPACAALFDAIPRRHTNRQTFEDRPLPAAVITDLQAAVSAEGAKLHVWTERGAKDRVAGLIAEADRRQMSDPAFREELASWLRPNQSRSGDGLPGYTQGLSGVVSMFGPLVVRRFDMGKSRAARDRELAAGSPALAVLGTRRDHRLDWLQAGMALERLLLTGRRQGVWASFLNQPVEDPQLRPHLAQLADEGMFPQVLIRLGYGNAPAATPRRQVGEVLVGS